LILHVTFWSSTAT